MSKTVLENLKKYRQYKSYSCEFMARKLLISKTFYWQIEQGNRRLSYENALKIADILGTDTDNLFRQEFESREG